MDTRTWERRIERLYLAAGSPSDWYAQTRSEVRALAKRNGITLSKAAGIVAALSPRTRWSTNIRKAEDVITTGHTFGFQAPVRKARRILEGARPLDALNGPKERSFYRNIMGDNEAVTIDIWMARAFGIEHAEVPGLYETLADVVCKVAAKHDVRPATMQAAIWTQVRGR